jgi:hypothetical protein
MKKRSLAAILFFLTFFINAEENRSLIRLEPLFIDGVGPEEARLIESLIQSYLSDFGEVVSYGASSFPGAPEADDFLDSWVRSPDYVLSGSIYLDRDSCIFTLKIVRTSTGETVSSTSVHKTPGELVLKARSLVESVFSTGGLEGGRSGETPPERISEGLIAGTWRGEPGIELIRLQRNGQGIAVFSSGSRMNLAYLIENDILKLRQDSPNTERFYHPLPLGIARRLAGAAEPMRWELRLYEKGAVLRGEKIFTGARYQGDTLIELLPGAVLEVEWIKSSR